MRSRKQAVRNLKLVIVYFAIAFAGLTLGISQAFAGAWTEHSQKLNVLAKNIETNELEIRELIEHKNHAEEPHEVAEIVNRIAEHQRALEKFIRDYEAERQHVRFQHPERNDELDRAYQRKEVKTVERLEKETGIQGRLDRVKARVLSTFPLPEKTEEEKKPKISPLVRLPASIKREATDEDAPETVRLVK